MNDVNQDFKNVVKQFSGVEAIITPEELKNVFSYVKSMEENMNQLKKELDTLNSKFNSSPSNASEGHQITIQDIKESLKQDLSEKKDSALREMQDILNEIKTGIVEKAAEIKQCVHDKNLEGLNAVLSKLHLKELCEKMSNLLEKAIDKTKNNIERVVYIENEIGQAKEHLKNAGNPEMPTTVKGESAINLMPIKSFMNSQRKLMVGMKENTDSLSENLKQLSQKVEQKAEIREEKRKEILGKSIRLPAHGASIGSIGFQR